MEYGLQILRSLYYSVEVYILCSVAHGILLYRGVDAFSTELLYNCNKSNCFVVGGPCGVSDLTQPLEAEDSVALEVVFDSFTNLLGFFLMVSYSLYGFKFLTCL